MSDGSAAAPLTLGTAGHIDHGKTALVRALTGHHTDRLPAPDAPEAPTVSQVEADDPEPGEGAARFRALERSGRAVRTGRNLHFHPELGTSRRYAQALLEHLDAERVTRRDGDAHFLRRRVPAE